MSISTTLNEIDFVKFEMAKSRCCAKAFFFKKCLAVRHRMASFWS